MNFKKKKSFYQKKKSEKKTKDCTKTKKFNVRHRWNKDNSTENMIEYITRVCREAAEKEGKENDVLWQFCIVKKNVIFSMKSKYDCVRKRILYRMTSHFNKIFSGLHFQFIYENSVDMREQFNEFYKDTQSFGSVPLSNGVDLNFGFAKWDLFGMPVILLSFHDDSLISPDAWKHTSMGNEAPENKHLQNLIESTGNPNYAKQNLTWEQYSKDYEAVYGTLPYCIERTYKNF